MSCLCEKIHYLLALHARRCTSPAAAPGQPKAHRDLPGCPKDRPGPRRRPERAPCRFACALGPAGTCVLRTGAQPTARGCAGGYSGPRPVTRAGCTAPWGIYSVTSQSSRSSHCSPSIAAQASLQARLRHAPMYLFTVSQCAQYEQPCTGHSFPSLSAPHRHSPPSPHSIQLAYKASSSSCCACFFACQECMLERIKHCSMRSILSGFLPCEFICLLLVLCHFSSLLLLQHPTQSVAAMVTVHPATLCCCGIVAG